MENRFKIVRTEQKNKIDLEQLGRDLQEVGEDASGYILTYKNKKDNSYCILSNSFTCEEGIFAAQLMINGIIRDENDR